MRIALIGNCQVQSLAVLTRAMVDGADVRLFDYSQAYSRSDETRAKFADSLGNCDLILAQTALLSFTSERDLRPRFGDRLITIANFYFRGLFPDSCYVGDFNERLAEPLAVHSVLVLDAFRRGLSQADALLEFNTAAMERLGLLNAWTGSMDEMRRREAGGTVDVPVADLMEEASRIYPAFLTMNHPSLALLAEYLTKVLAFAGVAFSSVNPQRLPDPLAEHDTTPILDEVAEYLSLPYRVSQRWKINALGGRFIGRDEFVSLSYSAYAALDEKRLLVHSPTDLVQSLGADPGLAYLVDADAALPGDPSARSAIDRSHSMRLPAEVWQALRPLETAVADIRVHIHRVHSFQEIADPKIEWLFQNLQQALKAGPEPARGEADSLKDARQAGAPAAAGLRRAVRRLRQSVAGLLAAIIRRTPSEMQ